MKKALQAFIITLCIICQPYSTFAKVLPHTEDILLSNLNTTIPNPDSPQNTAELIDNFCNIYSPNRQTYDEVDTHYFYDPQQSLFLTVLCQENSQETADKVKKYLQHSSFQDFGINCSTSQDNGNTCASPLHKNIHNIYNNITKELIDAMTAQAYGYPGITTSDDPISLSDLSYDILQNYGSDRGGSQALCSKDEPKECLIPKTRKILIQYLKSARKLTQSYQRIQKKFPKNKKKFKCTEDEKKKGTYDIILCGLSYDAPITDKHNLIANELLRYSNFVSFYAEHLKNDLKTQPQNQQSSSIDGPSEKATHDANAMLAKYDIAVKATRKSIQHIAQIEATFPVHIHLLAYHEMITTVRNKLAKTYTPLHQLFYKLINVQKQGG